jgi:integrase/recombinase XerD
VSVNSRDKFLISGLYESGCRVSEWLNIKLKDIVFDESGAKIKVSGKTGQRNIRLIDSVPYLHELISNHPFKHDAEQFLFISFASNVYGHVLKMGTVGTRLRTYSKRAGIQKKIYPHLLRHSRLTWLAQNEGFNERDLRIFAGWSSTSDMPNTYLHYGEEEVDKKLRKAKGIYSEKETKLDKFERKALTPRECPRCNRINPATALYCNCGMVLDINESTKIEDLKTRAIEQAIEEFMKIAQNPTRLEEFNKFKNNV